MMKIRWWFAWVYSFQSSNTIGHIHTCNFVTVMKIVSTRHGVAEIMEEINERNPREVDWTEETCLYYFPDILKRAVQNISEALSVNHDKIAV